MRGYIATIERLSRQRNKSLLQQRAWSERRGVPDLEIVNNTTGDCYEGL